MFVDDGFFVGDLPSAGFVGASPVTTTTTTLQTSIEHDQTHTLQTTKHPKHNKPTNSHRDTHAHTHTGEYALNGESKAIRMTVGETRPIEDAISLKDQMTIDSFRDVVAFELAPTPAAAVCTTSLVFNSVLLA